MKIKFSINFIYINKTPQFKSAYKVLYREFLTQHIVL